MKIDRLMGILTLLLRRDSVTAPELARRFEVSRRTINRDIDDLCRAGIPLVTVRGHGGGISIAEGYRIEKSLVTREELQALLAGLRGLDSVSSTPRAGALADKLAGKGRIEPDDTIVIDLSSHYRDSLTEKIELLREAALRGRIVSFRYYYGQGESERRVEPYKLVFKWSAWYLLAYCLRRQAFRLFKLNRLWELREEAETFLPRAIPEEELAFGAFLSQENYRLSAIFDAKEKYRLVEEYGVGCYAQREDGALLFERDFASYENMRQWVLSFGDRVQVLSPRTLREDLRKQAEKLLSMYDQT